MAIHQLKHYRRRGYIARHYRTVFRTQKEKKKREHAKDTFCTNAGITKTKEKKLTSMLEFKKKKLTACVGVKLNRPYIPLNEPELWKLSLMPRWSPLFVLGMFLLSPTTIHNIRHEFYELMLSTTIYDPPPP